MTTPRGFPNVRRGSAVLGVALLIACAPVATRQARLLEPVACTDSTYLQLRRQHPDSLSERAAERLRMLDRDCTIARRQAIAEQRGVTDTRRGTGHWMGGAVGILMVALMVAMVIAMA